MEGRTVLMNITSGIIEDAQRVIVYGPEGIGKSTFASKFPRDFHRHGRQHKEAER